MNNTLLTGNFNLLDNLLESDLTPLLEYKFKTFIIKKDNKKHIIFFFKNLDDSDLSEEQISDFINGIKKIKLILDINFGFYDLELDFTDVKFSMINLEKLYKSINLAITGLNINKEFKLNKNSKKIKIGKYFYISIDYNFFYDILKLFSNKNLSFTNRIKKKTILSLPYVNESNINSFLQKEPIQNFINKIKKNINNNNKYFDFQNSKLKLFESLIIYENMKTIMNDIVNPIINGYINPTINGYINNSKNNGQTINLIPSVNEYTLNNIENSPLLFKTEEIEKTKKIKDYEVIDEIKKKYKLFKNELIENIKNKKDLCLSNIKRLYQEYNNIFSNKFSNFKIKQFIGDENDELTIYKNFIRIMVLKLNDNSVKYLLNNILDNNLELDSFYVYFIDEILSSSNKNNENIIEYDINLNLIKNEDPRLDDHIYQFSFYFKFEGIDDGHFRNIKYMKFIPYDNINLNLDFNLNEKKIIIDIIKNNENYSFNFYYLFNYVCETILKTNGFVIFYKDILIFIQKFLTNADLYNNLTYFFLIDYIFRNLSSTNEEHLKNYYLLGSTDRPLDGNRSNTYFFGNVFSFGKMNILEIYITLFNKELNIENLIYDLIINRFSYILKNEDATLYQSIMYSMRFKDSNFEKLLKNEISVNKFKTNFTYNYKKETNAYIKKKNNQNELSYFNLEIKKFKYLFDYFQNIMNKKNNTNYILKLMNCHIEDKNIGKYFNIASYPTLFIIKNKINHDFEYNNIFYNIIYLLEGTDDELFNMKKKALYYILTTLDIVLNTYNISKLNESINKSEINNEFFKKFLNEQNSSKNSINILYDKIYKILIKKYNHLDISIFFFLYLDSIKDDENILNNIKKIYNEKNKNKINDFAIYRSELFNYIKFLLNEEQFTKYIISKNKTSNNENNYIENNYFKIRKNINDKLSKLKNNIISSSSSLEKLKKIEDRILKKNKRILENLSVEDYYEFNMKLGEIKKQINDDKKSLIINGKKLKYIKKEFNKKFIKNKYGVLKELKLNEIGELEELKNKLKKKYNNQYFLKNKNLFKFIENIENLIERYKKYRKTSNNFHNYIRNKEIEKNDIMINIKQMNIKEIDNFILKIKKYKMMSKIKKMYKYLAENFVEINISEFTINKSNGLRSLLEEHELNRSVLTS